ncbi:MAG: folate family ECF transporter S component [Oscillibacter sp.]|nr:folate family ECF transporter S component [Oscillibacter sp.]
MRRVSIANDTRYPHPFSAAYWRGAAAELRDLRKLLFAALMIALCIVLGAVPAVVLPYGGRVTWGFLARALCGCVCGPVLGAVFGFAEDILSFFLTGGGGYPFFPGYTLTTMLGVFIYALFLYRADLTVRRVFLAKLLTNIENVVLGALWMAILSGKAYLATASASAIKNLVMLPVQTAILCALLALLLPYLKKSGLVPGDTASRLRL